jgi:predicted metal-dependent phosphoesterase TrpH
LDNELKEAAAEHYLEERNEYWRERLAKMLYAHAKAQSRKGRILPRIHCSTASTTDLRNKRIGAMGN